MARYPIRPLAWLLGALLAGMMLSGCANNPNQVVVYTAEKDVIIQAVTGLWAKSAPDIKLQTVAASSNEVVQRVRSEHQRPLGDVVWGVGAEGLAANPELFVPYTTSETKAIDPRWLEVAAGQPWQPNNVVPTVLIYNTKLVSAAQAPSTWRDLADPRWKGKLAYASPDKSGSAYTQLATMVAVLGDNPAGWRMVGRIMANCVILNNSSKVPKGVSDGEYAAGLSYENVAGLYVKGGAPVKIVYPRDGTSVTPDGNALIRGAPHPEAARRFLDFLQSEPVQELLARELALRAARMGVPPPPGLPPLDQIKPAPGYSFQWGAERRKDFIEKWLALTASQGR